MIACKSQVQNENLNSYRFAHREALQKLNFLPIRNTENPDFVNLHCPRNQEIQFSADRKPRKSNFLQVGSHGNPNSCEFALAPEAVIQRSRPRNASQATGHAHFELATHFVTQGKRELAIKHFRAAHALVPDNWTFRRQAWSLEPVGDGPMARFWQGPGPEGDWPYEGDWVKDIRREGAENYYESWKP